jgi:hypothetical protein
VNVLLDENFPLDLYKHLRRRGVPAEHILLQERGLPDSAIRGRLAAEPDLLFLTQDTDFLDLGFECQGRVVVSRVRQSLSIRTRVDIWLRGLDTFMATSPTGSLFELIEPGLILPWETLRRQSTRPEW